MRTIWILILLLACIVSCVAEAEIMGTIVDDEKNIVGSLECISDDIDANSASCHLNIEEPLPENFTILLTVDKGAEGQELFQFEVTLTEGIGTTPNEQMDLSFTFDGTSGRFWTDDEDGTENLAGTFTTITDVIITLLEDGSHKIVKNRGTATFNSNSGAESLNFLTEGNANAAISDDGSVHLSFGSNGGAGGRDFVDQVININYLMSEILILTNLGPIEAIIKTEIGEKKLNLIIPVSHQLTIKGYLGDATVVDVAGTITNLKIGHRIDLDGIATLILSGNPAYFVSPNDKDKVPVQEAVNLVQKGKMTHQDHTASVRESDLRPVKVDDSDLTVLNPSPYSPPTLGGAEIVISGPGPEGGPN